MLRGLDDYEKAALGAVKQTMGIVGGKRKIKSKDVLDMKKGKNIQKGGQGVQGSYTNPTDRTYIPPSTVIQSSASALYPLKASAASLAKTDAQVLDAIRYCEQGHYDSEQSTLLGLSTQFTNTDSKYDMIQLRDCIGKKLYGTSYTGRTATEKGRGLSLITSLPYSAATSFCTTAQNDRGVCPSGRTAADPTSTSATGKGKGLWPGATGGKRFSRKKNPRSSGKRATIKKQKH